jgi:1,4-alpha-glucan branching enzyme
LGDFNAWSTDGHPMRRRKDGSWAVTVRLPRRARYEYRFLVDDRHWVTDEEGDGLRPNEFGSANSVVMT